jgi:hemerythrin
MYFEWHEGMKTGHPLIDEQHQNLMKHLEQLMKNASKGVDPGRLEVELQFFERYVVEHFTDEELLHQESGAPDFEDHVAAHRTLIDMTEGMIHDIKMNGVSLKTEMTFYNGLVKYFISQIHEFDVPLASFINAKR